MLELEGLETAEGRFEPGVGDREPEVAQRLFQALHRAEGDPLGGRPAPQLEGQLERIGRGKEDPSDGRPDPERDFDFLAQMFDGQHRAVIAQGSRGRHRGRSRRLGGFRPCGRRQRER